MYRLVSNVGGIAPGIRTQDLQSRVNVKGGSFRSHLDAASARRARDIFVSTRTSAQGAGGLSGEKILELAKKYDPEQMTQEEYVSFVDELVEEGVLTEWDKNFIGYSNMVCLGDPDGEWWGQFCVTDVGPIGSKTLNTLSDADGNLLKWAEHTTSWNVIIGGDNCYNSIRIREFQKMLPIINAMSNARHG